jgi:hypothetical protein
MAINTNFNIDPYYDDFDDAKNYHRILFKPGYAVQARELTQQQTILQDQINKFGDYIFQSGSVVTGGKNNFQTVQYINIASTFASTDIAATNFEGKIIQNAANTKRAFVIKTYDPVTANGQPITLVVNQIFGDRFANTETIYTANADVESITYFANTTSNSAMGNCQAWSVTAGVYYYGGYFITTQDASVAIDKYSVTGNALIGYDVTETIVSNNQDTSLLDPAQDASNFQAPGADRFNIELTLNTRPLDSVDKTQFIEIARVVNGQLISSVETPIWGKIEETIARRTYDESGDYIVRQFDIGLDSNVSNTAQLDITLSPGKAYVKGYEFSTISATTLTVPKPRTKENVDNKRLSSSYGGYIYANNLFNTLPTNLYGTVDIHCVDAASVNTGNASLLANTKIGTAKIKAMSFDSTSNASNGGAFVYAVYVADINTGSLFDATTSNSGGYPIAGAGNTTTFTLPGLFSTTDQAYQGATIRMTSGPGSTDGTRKIASYEGATRSVVVDTAFSASINTQSHFVIDFDFGQAEALAVYSGTTRVAGANVHVYSKDAASLYTPAYVSEPQFESMIFDLGDSNVSDNSTSFFNYEYERLYQGVSLAAGVTTALTVGSGETLVSAATNTAKSEYYTVVCTAAGTNSGPDGGYKAGQLVPSGQFTVDTTARTITVFGGGNMTVNLYATISSTNPTSKTKTYIRANTAVQTQDVANSVFGSSNTSAYVFIPQGQTHIAQGLVNKTPGVDQTLYVTDIHCINAIFDYSNTAITTANSGSAINVTSRYALVTGQKDSYYDWGAIRLLPGQTAPTGPLLVRYNRFTSSGAGFFNVDSYTRLGDGNYTYGEIPQYSSKTGGRLSLRNSLDFRPVRQDGTTVYSANNFVFDVNETTTGPKVPLNTSDFIISYSYYLPRVDRVVLTTDRKLQVLPGIPGVNPVAPVEPKDAMTLYVLNYPAYLQYPFTTQIQRLRNKRYTMKDIGGLEKRIENLEYYTSLSLLEIATMGKQDLSILDSQNLPRFKNGIVVDSFVDKSVAEVTGRDFSAAIDIVNNEARGSYNITAVGVFSNTDTANTTAVTDVNVEYSGPMITCASTTETWLSQPLASKTINVNPFNFINYLGKLNLFPSSDVWNSQTRVESQLVDLTGGAAAADAWSSIQSTSWGAWQTTWTGVETNVIPGTERTTSARQQISKAEAISKGIDQKAGKGSRSRFSEETLTTTSASLETITTNEARSGILSQIVPTTLTKSLGDKVVDVSIIPYMRAKTILATGTGFKPLTPLFSFFDNVNVSEYITNVNQFKFANNDLQFQTIVGDSEQITFRTSDTNVTLGTGFIIQTSNNNGFIVNIDTVAGVGTWSGYSNVQVVGAITGTVANLSGWQHFSGFAISANSTAMVLDYHAGSATNATKINYQSQTVTISSGTGAGQQRTISDYNPTTRTLTVSSPWTTVPDATSNYTIGRPQTTEEGAISVVFSIPGDVFRVGEKNFRMIDVQTGLVESSVTNGDATFFSQGVIQTVQEQSISVFVPSVVRSSVSEERTSERSSIKQNSSTSTKQIQTYYDPLAQNFLISSNQYPQGMFLSSVRVCFQTKDVSVPVTMQIRPTVNGFPSSGTVYPFATVTLTPDKVKTVAPNSKPDLNDVTKYTEFVFDAPIFLQPGEHSVVFVSNSNSYFLYCAKKDEKNFIDDNNISALPYIGSLFESQNGSTWIPTPATAMLFSLHKKVFTTATALAHFEVDTSYLAADTPYDLAHFMTTDVVLANTSVNYEFISQQFTANTTHPYLPIVPFVDYRMVDGYDRRVLNKTTGNTTVKIRATMATQSRDISPMIDKTRLNWLAVENKINNLPLSNSGVVLSNGGTGYANSADVVVTISGGGGAGAAAVATVTSNVISAVHITSSGTGYTTSPTITITPGSGGGSGAVVTYNGEDKRSGGTSAIRYFTKQVTLAEGFDSEDLRVYLTTYLPPLSGIQVYYKVLSTGDAETFEDKNYAMMTQLNNTTFVSANESDYRELTFAPGINNVANNYINYTSGSTSFSDFRTFAIKVVLYGQSTVDVPRFKELRAIALPRG